MEGHSPHRISIGNVKNRDKKSALFVKSLVYPSQSDSISNNIPMLGGIVAILMQGDEEGDKLLQHIWQTQ